MATDLITGDAIEVARTYQDDTFDMLIGSPPYCDARTYGIGAQRKCPEWVEWMLEVSREFSRIVRGPMFWVVAGVTRKRNYWPAPEGLMWEWWRGGGELYRPCCFKKTGIPGSGGRDYLRADWEYVVCMKRPGPLPWSDNTAMGKPCKYRKGGEMSNRLQDGGRVSVQPTKRKPNGEMETQGYHAPKIANPGNVISGKVGGGHLGHRLAHENEAPFPEWLVEFFVKSFCPPGGWCIDPFSGSGTTAAVCHKTGRNCIGIELRAAQNEIARNRVADIR